MRSCGTTFSTKDPIPPASRPHYMPPPLAPQLSVPSNVAETIPASCRTIGRKRVLCVERCGRPCYLPLSPPESHLFSPERVPDVSPTMLLPQCQRRKWSSVPSAPSTPATKISWIEDGQAQCSGDSILEALPFDLLIRILCCLHHDDLKPVFHVSQRLRTAVQIARQSHFNFTTPRQKHKLTLSPENQWLFSSYEELHPPTLGAPKQPSKSGPDRVSASEMRQLTAVLFSDASTYRHSKENVELSAYADRQSCSKPYSEEEICHAVAQNSLQP